MAPTANREGNELRESAEAVRREPQHDLNAIVSKLQTGAQDLQKLSLSARRKILNECISNTANAASEWVAVACEAKRITLDSPTVAEEVLAGPACLLRYLQVFSEVLSDIESTGKPRLPGKPRRNSVDGLCVPILPVRSQYDSLIFRGMRSEVWFESGADDDDLFTDIASNGSGLANVNAVLGAGNVSAIPATDMLFKVFHDHESVALKLNPVNDYLDPIFRNVFKPLIDRNILHTICGGKEVGSELIYHPDIDSVHITGSQQTYETIVWGNDPVENRNRRMEETPLLEKPITSELGNVTPWVIVPGKYTKKQLRSQAENLAASIVNNASFNCLATKMIVTCNSWSQRSEFLGLLDSILQKVPRRFAYYPGAIQRFETATQTTVPNDCNGYLPWTLLKDQRPNDAPQLFQDESFVCVCAETKLDASSDLAFLERAVEFVNHELLGTLCASLTLPNEFRESHPVQVDSAISQLRYGTVCINQWSGLSYGLMTPPWGGYAKAEQEIIQSGQGHVHNAYCLKNFDKAVLWGPLCTWPNPVWSPTHRNPLKTSWALTKLYEHPTAFRLPKLFYNALKG